MNDLTHDRIVELVDLGRDLTAPLPPLTVAGRIDRVRDSLDEVDGLIVTHLTNVRWLTGFTGSAGLLLIGPNRAVFVTDGRYTEQAGDELGRAGCEAEVVISGNDQDEVIGRLVQGLGVSAFGLEAEHLSWAAVTKKAPLWLGAAAQPVATSEVVENLRLAKDEAEIVRLARAAAIADAAFAQIRSRLDEGVEELAFARELDTRMRDLGAADVSFETIVAGGPNGARPHHQPGQRRIAAGDLVVCDFGALVDGYHSDMTRTVQVGDVGEDRRRMWDVVIESQAAGVATVRAGVSVQEVDATCRDLIAAAGWADAFSHGTGHGVGLDIHEAPRVSGAATATLGAGHVITVEPGVYLSGLGGVRIEDTLVVTDTGAVPLNRTPKLAAP